MKQTELLHFRIPWTPIQIMFSTQLGTSVFTFLSFEACDANNTKCLGFAFFSFVLTVYVHNCGNPDCNA